MAERRYVLDCRALEGSDCSISISGRADEVLELGTQHAVARHAEIDGPELRAALKESMRPVHEPEAPEELVVPH